MSRCERRTLQARCKSVARPGLPPAFAVEKGRSSRPGIKLGICGEHGGDPDSVKFCHKLSLNYVSCSPFPVARLAAGQPAIEEKRAAKKK